MGDIALVGILVLVIGAPIIYIVRAKKRGVHCIGCGSEGGCGSENGCGSDSSCGCGGGCCGGCGHDHDYDPAYDSELVCAYDYEEDQEIDVDTNRDIDE